MEPFNNPDDLARQISSDLEELRSEGVIIGIDGKDGVRKSWLAGKLSALLSAPVLSLDDYVVENQGGYIAHLRESEIRLRLGVGEPIVIVDGVCLLAAAERCGFNVEKLIYVKRMSPYGDWRDREECDPNRECEIPIDELTEQLRKFAEFERLLDGEDRLNAAYEEVVLPELTKELIGYHADYRPIRQAAYLFEWVDA